MMGFVLTRFFALALVLCAMLRAMLCGMRPAFADAAHINQIPPTVAGTYRYPLDGTGKHFTPGYFYAPQNGNVRFMIDAPAGTTLHLFDDVAGTHELRLPETLRQAGQPLSRLPKNAPLLTPTSSYTQAGEVWLMQGWHKCYLEYKVVKSLLPVALRSYPDLYIPPANSRAEVNAYRYIRLEYSTGVLYDAVQSVSSSCVVVPWKERASGGLLCTGDTTIALPDGSPAVGDKIVARIAKVTRDLEGKQILSYVSPSGANRPLLTISSASKTDRVGKVSFVVEWDGTMPNTPPSSKTQSSPYSSLDPLGFVWMEFIDASRPDLRRRGAKGVTLKIGPMYTPFLVPSVQ